MTGTELAIRAEDLDPKAFNVLHPIVQVHGGHQSTLLAESWAGVKIQPDSADVYHDFRFANAKDGKNALSAVGLGKIAAAAGIRWITEQCVIEQRERRPDGHVYIAFKATGAVRQPNGEWFLIAAHADLDTASELEELIDTKVRKWRRESKSAPGAFPSSSVLAQIQDDAKRDLLQIREFSLPLVETKAQNRVIRKLLSLNQVYTNAELARPFAVPRLIYRPDLVDARSLEAATIEGRRAAVDVFGTPGALGPSSPAVQETGVRDTRATSPRPDEIAAPEGQSGGRRGAGSRQATTRRTTAKAPGPDPVEDGPGPGPSLPDDSLKAHAFVGTDQGSPCAATGCGWAFEHAVHRVKAEQASLA